MSHEGLRLKPRERRPRLLALADKFTRHREIATPLRNRLQVHDHGAREHLEARLARHKQGFPPLSTLHPDF